MKCNKQNKKLNMKAIRTFLGETVKYSIYLDMDGVLTDFRSQVYSLGYGTVSELESEGADHLWKVIASQGEGFWAEMPWMPDGKKLWEEVKKYNPTILSAPAPMKASSEGKRKWIKKNLGPSIKYIFIRARDKHLYAKHRSILIDDDIRNITEWRQKGGIAIHHKDADTTIKKLRSIFGSNV